MQEVYNSVKSRPPSERAQRKRPGSWGGKKSRGAYADPAPKELSRLPTFPLGGMRSHTPRSCDRTSRRISG